MMIMFGKRLHSVDAHFYKQNTNAPKSKISVRPEVQNDLIFLLKKPCDL